MKLVASDGASLSSSVAFDGDTVVAGSIGAGIGGAVYVFRASDGKQLATLTADDAAEGDWFGDSVAIDGGTVVVGASSKDGDGGIWETGIGHVYVFRKDAWGTYDQVAKLKSSDAGRTSHAGADFGCSVAIDGSTIVVGAYDHGGGFGYGAAYVFREGATGTYDEVAKLTPADGPSYDGASDGQWGHNFGYAVAIDGGTVVVAARYDDDNGDYAGAVYVFRESAGTYAQVAKLTAADGATWDVFGRSVAIDGGTIVVGAYGDDPGGSAYVLRTTDGGVTYNQVAKLTAADAAANDWFGYSVAIDGSTVVVGSLWDDDAGTNSGSAYVFRATDDGATYDEVAKLTAADAAAGDQFGSYVAITGDTVVIIGGGAAYVFEDESSWWDYFSSKAAKRPLPPAMVLLVAMLAL